MRGGRLWLVAAMWSCMDLDGQDPAAGAKFITFVQSLDHINVAMSLLRKLHDDTLTIRYGFAPACRGKYSNAQVEADTTKVMRLWLQPLRDWSERPASDPIVDSFVYLRSTGGEWKTSSGGRRYYKLRGPEGKAADSDLDITFYCSRGRSFIFFAATPPRIHLYDEGDKYSLATLAHEVGHALGLSDTYVEYRRTDSGKLVEADSSVVIRYNRSDCGSQAMVGCQPLSLMNKLVWLIEDDSKPHLGADDIEGIKWLYRYVFDEGAEGCPRGFISELTTRGCVPENPLAFALQQGDIDNAIELLSERGLAIDSQDEKGNTVMHYAAQRAASHGGHFYRKGLENGASPDIRNRHDTTPRELLFPAIETAVKNGELYIAADLISLAISD